MFSSFSEMQLRSDTLSSVRRKSDGILFVVTLLPNIGLNF